MTKPTSDDYRKALALAEELRGLSADYSGLDHCLRYLYARNGQLEHMAQELDRYLRFGNPESEHAHLVRMMQKLHEDPLSADEDEQSSFGLE